MQNLETDKRAFETLSWHLAPKALFALLILVFLLTNQYSLHSLPATCLYFYISHLEENTWPPAAVYIVFDTASLSIKKNSHLKTRGQETDRQTRSGNGTSQTRTGQTQKSIHFGLGKIEKLREIRALSRKKEKVDNGSMAARRALPPKKTGTEEISYSVTGINDPRNLSQHATPPHPSLTPLLTRSNWHLSGMLLLQVQRLFKWTRYLIRRFPWVAFFGVALR